MEAHPYTRLMDGMAVLANGKAVGSSGGRPARSYSRVGISLALGGQQHHHMHEMRKWEHVN
jgi:hypothetical protein